MSDLRTIHWREIRGSLAAKEQFVYDAMATRPPCTAKELAQAISWDKCSVRPRFSNLLEKFLIEPTGERRNGETVFRWISVETAEAKCRALADAELRAAHTHDTVKQMALF